MPRAKTGFSVRQNISLRAMNRKPENILPTIFLSLQARQLSSEVQQSIQKQETVVSSVAKSLPPYLGTTIAKSFILQRTYSWQERISPFLVCDEHVWWTQTDHGYKCFDSNFDQVSGTITDALWLPYTPRCDILIHGKPLSKTKVSSYLLP